MNKILELERIDAALGEGRITLAEAEELVKEVNEV